MDGLPFNIVDTAVVLILVISAVVAFLRGFTHELLSIVSWLGAIVATLYGFPYAQPYAREFIPVELLADVVAGVVIFVVVLAVLSVATRTVAKFIQGSGLGPLDRSLGLVFGILRGYVIACVVWIAVDWVLEGDRPAWAEEARSGPALDWGSGVLLALAPEDFLDAGEETADETLKNLERMRNTEAVYQSLNNAISKGDGKREPGGYNDDQRQQMDQLIDDIGR